MTSTEAFARYGAVRHELRATRFALGLATGAVRSDPTLLPWGDRDPLRPAHLALAESRLDATYALRLFAEFEDVCRDYWAAARPGRGRRPVVARTLLDRVAADRGIYGAILADAHVVRVYRNAVVHDGGRGTRQAVGVPSFDECHSRLARFTSFLPYQW